MRVAAQLVELADSIAAAAIPPSSDGEAFATLPIPDSPFHLLGRDAFNRVAILIAIDPGAPLGPLPPVRLENLAVCHAARCRISQGLDAPTEGLFSVVRCLADDAALRELFLEVMASVTRQLPERPATQRAAELIESVIRIFRELGKASERTVQGLWAELFILAGASDPLAVALAWRSSPFDHSDFAVDRQRVEVKSCSGTIRSHAFGAEQLALPGGAEGVVASLFCHRTAGGMSVGELWNALRSRIAADPSLLLRVDGIVAETLGDKWKESISVRFDWRVARDSLRFFDMKAIPAIGSNAPPEVSEIRFRADLSRVPPLSRAALEAAGGLFAATLPAVSE